MRTDEILSTWKDDFLYVSLKFFSEFISDNLLANKQKNKRICPNKLQACKKLGTIVNSAIHTCSAGFR